MKKFVSTLLILGLCLASCFLFSACNQSHTHSYTAEWLMDATHHWHMCTDANCGDIADKLEHTWDEGEITTKATKDADGVKTFTCTVCNQTRTEAVVYTPKTEVTQNEWDSFMKSLNFSLTIEFYDADSVLADTATIQSTQTCILTSYENEISYTVLEDNIWYDLWEMGGLYSSTPVENQEAVLCPISDYILGNYSDFKLWNYNETEKAYFLKGNATDDFIAYIYFEDGIATKMSVEEDDTCQIILIFDIGTTSIEAPEITNSIEFFEAFTTTVLSELNCEMTVFISDIPLFGAISFVCEVDGNVQHILESTFISETYIETVDGIQYQYSKTLYGKWVKEAIDDNLMNDITTSEVLQQLVDVNNYEAVEGQKNVYRQKADVVFEHCKDVTISFGNKSCIIEMVAFTSGMELRTMIVISNIGNVDIQLPTVA